MGGKVDGEGFACATGVDREEAERKKKRTREEDGSDEETITLRRCFLARISSQESESSSLVL